VFSGSSGACHRLLSGFLISAFLTVCCDWAQECRAWVGRFLQRMTVVIWACFCFRWGPLVKGEVETPLPLGLGGGFLFH
jgi:hypothetical protein